jgi:RNA polymerase sigma-70 factor (ECF subfamily)
MQHTKDIITAIYRAEVKKVYRYFYTRVLNRDQAEDLTSDTFFRLLKRLQKHEIASDTEAVKYLYGIVHIVFTEYLKTQYKFSFADVSIEEVAAEVEELDTQSGTQVVKGLHKRMLEFLPHLPEKQYAILKLRLIEKMPLEEICKKIKKDMNYVKTTQKRGIKNLKKLLACTPISI